MRGSWTTWRFYLLASTIVVGACTSVFTDDGYVRSQAPIARDYPASQQDYARAIEHWRRIAKDSGARIGAVYFGANLHTMALVVRNSKGSNFENTYHDLLLAAVVNAGIRAADVDERGSCLSSLDTCRVAVADPNVIHIETFVHLVEHAPDRFVRAPLGNYTGYTLVPAAIAAVATGLALGTVPIVGVIGGLGMAAATADVVSGQTTVTPNTEILVTSVVKRRSVAEIAIQGIYYVPPEEADDFTVSPLRYPVNRTRIIEVTDQ